MAYAKKTWKNRVSDYPNRRMLTDTNNNQTVYTIARYEGNVSQEGDAFTAENMNDLENRIDEGISDIEYTISSTLGTQVTYSLSGTTLTITTK